MSTRLEELLQAQGEEEEEETGGEPEPAPPEPDEPGEPDEPPEEPLGFDEGRFEKENRRHERELSKVFGDAFAGMAPCGTCGGVGFTPEDFTPPEPLPEPKADPTLVACEECNGWGDRLTPSLKETYQTITCTACTGTGYRDRDALEAMRQAQAYAAPVVPIAPPAPPQWNPTTNQWVDANGAPVYVAPPVSAPPTYGN